MTIPVATRLRIEPLLMSDAAELFAARSDPQAMAFWDGPPDTDPSQTAEVIKLLLQDVHKGTAFYWSARLRSDGSLVGVCDLSEIQHGQSAGIGFMLMRRFWSLRYGEEVVRCLLAEALKMGLKSVSARIHSANFRSRRLLLKTGFRLVAKRPSLEIRPGVYRDCEWYELELAPKVAAG